MLYFLWWFLGANIIVEKDNAEKRDSLMNVVYLIRQQMAFENVNKGLFLD